MKTLIAALLSVSVLVPAVGLACGFESSNTQPDVEQDLLKRVAGKSLTCTGNGAEIQSSISIYAIYRCIGSPVYGRLAVPSMPGGCVRISKITEDENGTLTVYSADFAEPEICRLN